MKINLVEQDFEEMEKVLEEENLMDYEDLFSSNGHTTATISDDLREPSVIIEVKIPTIDYVRNGITQTYAERSDAIVKKIIEAFAHE